MWASLRPKTKGYSVQHPDQHYISTPYLTWENATHVGLSDTLRNREGQQRATTRSAPIVAVHQVTPLAGYHKSSSASLVPDQRLGQGGSPVGPPTESGDAMPVRARSAAEEDVASRMLAMDNYALACDGFLIQRALRAHTPIMSRSGSPSMS
jgi:hypothetical protein